ncbi:MAG TPA: glycosyltransferase family 39 protein, partial [Pyrinomonadaceae bacterium]
MNLSPPKARDEAGPESERRPAFLSAWRWWLPPSCVALLLAFVFRDPFIGDWDGLDYTVLSLQGRPSTMALGRGLFIFFNHALYGLARAVSGLRPENAYLLFKYAVIAESFLAVAACWALAREVTDSERKATVAALLVATSPTFVVYGGQVMTDVPSLLLLVPAILFYLRGVRRKSLWLMIAGAALLGADVNVRETAAF